MVAFTPKQRREGRAYLLAILPRAKEMALEAEAEAISGPAKAAAQYFSEDNLDYVVIHQVSTGWNADLVFKKMPPGVSDMIGTPSDMPHRTREEAEKHGAILVAFALNLYRQHQENPPKEVLPPSFALFTFPIALRSEIYDSMIARLPDGFPLRAIGYEDTAHALNRIEEILDEHLPGLRENPKLMRRKWNKLSRDSYIRVISVLHIAALSGVTRYPPTRDTSATFHEESTTKQ